VLLLRFELSDLLAELIPLLAVEVLRGVVLKHRILSYLHINIMASNLPRVKILILGEGDVGKTSFLLQFINQEPKHTYMPIIDAEYKQKIIDYLSEKRHGCKVIDIQVVVWSTASTDCFHTIKLVYCKNCDGVLHSLVCFDGCFVSV
jgi:GTPase SAR1 family protein